MKGCSSSPFGCHTSRRHLKYLWEVIFSTFQMRQDHIKYLWEVILFISQVRQDRPGVGEWQRVGDITKKEIPHRGNVRDALDLQFQDTFYKISLQVSLFLIIFIILIDADLFVMILYRVMM